LRDIAAKRPHLSLLGALNHDPIKSSEANKLQDELAGAIVVFSDAIDWMISRTNAEHAECDIWHFDDEEADTLASAWLSLGARSPQAAMTARLAVELSRRYQVGIILAPRFIETFEFYAQHGGMTVIRSPFARQPRRVPYQPSTAPWQAVTIPPDEMEEDSGE
jgi:hypothetical protein